MYIKAIKDSKSFFQKYKKKVDILKTPISNTLDGGRVESAYQTIQIFWLIEMSK